MNENSDLLPNLAAQEDAFEVQLRGYSRRQVDEFVARCRSQVRELEERLGRALDDGEQHRQEIKALRQQALGHRPAHEEVSERISQILKLADDEAKAQKTRADDDIKKQLSEAQQEADRTRKEARDQAEHMLTAAQEQAERAISTARAEAEKTRNAARAEADHATADARKKADSVLSNAKAQAKQTLDEATARATAIHDGAERRLNLLSTRHGETIRRLTEILDGVSGLVAAETSRLSLEDEVDQNVAKAIAQKAAESAGADPASPNGGTAARGSGPGTPVNRPARHPREPDSRSGRTAPGQWAARGELSRRSRPPRHRDAARRGPRRAVSPRGARQPAGGARQARPGPGSPRPGSARGSPGRRTRRPARGRQACTGSKCAGWPGRGRRRAGTGPVPRGRSGSRGPGGGRASARPRTTSPGTGSGRRPALRPMAASPAASTRTR